MLTRFRRLSAACDRVSQAGMSLLFSVWVQCGQASQALAKQSIHVLQTIISSSHMHSKYLGDALLYTM